MPRPHKRFPLEVRPEFGSLEKGPTSLLEKLEVFLEQGCAGLGKVWRGWHGHSSCPSGAARLGLCA